jgi:hypothetical protein
VIHGTVFCSFLFCSSLFYITLPPQQCCCTSQLLYIPLRSTVDSITVPPHSQSPPHTRMLHTGFVRLKNSSPKKTVVSTAFFVLVQTSLTLSLFCHRQRTSSSNIEQRYRTSNSKKQTTHNNKQQQQHQYSPTSIQYVK